MATLNKLSLCGIRCFGERQEDAQIVSFGKPLTLILGANGSGKSTIIEALRFVTAQREPAGKGVFVHDPHLAKVDVVKGFVKLKLHDALNKEVHLSKSIQAKKAARGVNIKNLDSTISVKGLDPSKPDEWGSLSSRCADFLPRILNIFGVSKAILENVIFCTQEDSFWPLDTDQKLKEKFDQIFDSDKYNKCLKKVRDQRKKMIDDKKKSETELKYLKENKLAATSKREQLAALEREIKDLNEQIEALNASLGPVEASLKEVHVKEVEVSKIYTTQETTKTELAGVMKLIKELETKIKLAKCEFIGTDEDLEKALKDCDEEAQSMTALKNELSEAESKERGLTQQNKNLIGQIGQLKKLAEMNQDRETDKERRMRALASELGMESSHLSVDGLERRVNAKDKEIVELQRSMEVEEENVQTEVDKSREVVCTQESVVKQKEDALSANQKERVKLRRELEEVEASQARVDRVAVLLRQAAQDLDDHLRIHNLNEIKGDITRWQSELRQAEEELSSVETNVTRMQEFSAVMKELEVQQELLASKSADIRRLSNRHEDALIELLGKAPEIGFKIIVEKEAETMGNRLRDLQNQLTRKEKELTTLEGRRRFLKESLQDQQETLQRCLDKVYEETSGDDWEQSVKKMQQCVDDLQEEKGTLTSSSCMYQRYIRQLQKPKPCCPLCTRDFKAEEEARTLAEELANKMRDVPNRLEINRKALMENQEKLNRLLALQSIQDRIATLKNKDIPTLTKELEEVETNLTRVKKEIGDVTGQKQKPEKSVGICNALKGDMTLLDQLIADQRRIKLDVEKLELRVPANTPVTGLRDALAKQDSLRHSRKLARTHLDEAHARMQRYNEQLQSLQNHKHTLGEELRSLEGGAGSRSALEERCSELQAVEGLLQGELAAAREALGPLQRSLSEVIAKLRQLKESNRSKFENRRKDVDLLKRQLDEVRRIQKECAEHQTKGVEKKLDDLQLDADSLERELARVKTKKESISAKVGSLANNEVRRRELQDNKNLRQRVAERNVLKNKLETLDASFGNIGYDELIREKKRLKAEEEAIGKKKATIVGRVGALTGSTTVVKQELESRIFRKVDEEYKRELVRCKVVDAVALDLLRYATSMEYAMSVYHKQQMERVNEFVHEYWRKIYKGNDVDYVEIQTDEVEVSEKRRNYSYKLVMVKGDVRMDMRNRCSAGQKMLASLIIRMALAEVFSANCGILTLDEPTTNLDAKNIESLAEALHDIVESKEANPNSNLQLIVISHDEEFVKNLMKISGTPTYITVRREKSGRSRVLVSEYEEDFNKAEQAGSRATSRKGNGY